jgi:hypothetical protein
MPIPLQVSSHDGQASNISATILALMTALAYKDSPLFTIKVSHHYVQFESYALSPSSGISFCIHARNEGKLITVRFCSYIMSNTWKTSNEWEQSYPWQLLLAIGKGSYRISI